MAYYDRTKLGRIISRCTSDISAMREINVWGMHVIVTNFLMMIVAGIMLLVTGVLAMITGMLLILIGLLTIREGVMKALKGGSI